MASPGGRRRGYISEELQQAAKKTESPIVSELLVSARKGYTLEVGRLLQEGGAQRAAITDKHGRTCLHLACVHGHFETALAILQTGLVDINSANKRGLTPLHDASAEGHTRIALLLLAMGAYLPARTRDGWTCLMCACSNGHLQLALILIAAGCDVNTTTKIGLTALHIAAWKGHGGVVEMLVRAGCSTLVQSHSGKTALQLAQEEEQHECVTILQGATNKQSEDPVYRISSLEGQLRLCQEKLVHAHREHGKILMNERSRAEETIAYLKQTHNAEMEEAGVKINALEERVSEVERCLEKAVSRQQPQQPEVKVDGSTPEGSPSRRRRHKAKENGKKKEEPRAVVSPTRSLSPDSKRRSASLTDISGLDRTEAEAKEKERKLHMGVSSTPQSPRRHRMMVVSHSPDATAALTPKPNHDKPSITDLVAESLKNPSSIASIRRELKSDGLTPKIQRKFLMKTTPPSLPSMSSGTIETSPLAKESTKASPKNSLRINAAGSNGK